MKIDTDLRYDLSGLWLIEDGDYSYSNRRREDQSWTDVAEYVERINSRMEKDEERLEALMRVIRQHNGE